MRTCYLPLSTMLKWRIDKRLMGMETLPTMKYFIITTTHPSSQEKSSMENTQEKKEFTKYKLVQMQLWLYILRMFLTPQFSGSHLISSCSHENNTP
jgi:hypothetical protein